MTGTLAAILAQGDIPSNAFDIPILPEALDTDGLTGWWDFDDATLFDDNGTKRIMRIPPRIGDLGLVPSDPTSSPAIFTNAAGRQGIVTTIARQDRLLLEPAPAGVAWPHMDAAAFSFFIRFKSNDLTATIKGIANLFGLQVRELSGNKVQIQRAYAGGTENYQVAYDTSTESVLGIVGDFGTATPTVAIMRNGVPITPHTTANWTALAGTVACLGSVGNPGTPGAASILDMLMYDVVKSADEAVAISATLLGDYD